MVLAEMKKRFRPRTLLILVAGAVVSLAVLFVLVIPQHREAEQLRRRIAVARSSLEMRRQMEPVKQALRQAEAVMPPVERPGVEVRLSLADVGRLTDIFDSMAATHGLKVASVSPDASSVTRDGLLAVRVGLVGPADAFRRFLLALGGYGPLVKIESAATTAGRDGREYAVKCWLAVR